MKRNAQYIPALSGSIIRDMEMNEPHCRIYNKASDPYYSLQEFDDEPLVLISAGTNHRKETFRYDLSVGKETKVFIDSGGYQLKTGAINKNKYTDEVALSWSEKNGEIFPILDRPTGSEFYDDDYALEASLKSAKYYYENRKHNGEQILNVLQGENKGALEHWYQKISQYEFDGWAYGGITNLNPDGELAMEAKFATGLLVLFQNKEFEKEKCKRLHLFGIGSIKYMIYFQYIQMLLNDMGLDIQITYDTSTYGFVAKNGVYWLGKNENDSMIGKTISNRNDYAPSKEFRLPCIYDCPVCASVENVEEYFMELDKDGDRKTSKLTRISTLHNLYVQKRVEQETRNILSSRCFTTYKVFFSGHTALNLERLSNIFGKTRDRGEEARKLLIAVFGEEEVV